MTIREQIENLADKFRQELGLEPWDEFERKTLEKWDNEHWLTEEARETYKKSKRQCGKTTKVTLFRLAEAVVTSKPVLVCGVTGSHTKILYENVRSLADRLNLNVAIDKSPRQVITLSESYFE